jgi:putative SOS response-associated peptidase YedK
VLRWGLVPYWAKDLTVGFSNINAKAEGAKASRRFATHSSDDAALCQSIISMSGKRRRTANSLMQLRSPIGD